MREKKKGSVLKYLLIGIVVIFVLSALFGDEEDPAENKETTQTESTAANQATTTAAGETTEAANTGTTEAPTAAEPYQAELTAGHYTAGIDFPTGKYDLTAVKGSGNVSSSNMFTGGLNEIMGKPKDEYSIDEFKNADLDDGTVLSVSSNLVLKISSDKSNLSGLKARTNELTETIELSSGNYVAGEDFPAGIYTIVAKSGSGNVSSSNMFEGGINEVMGDTSDGFSIKEFKNTSLDDGTELTISGVSVELVPSK